MKVSIHRHHDPHVPRRGSSPTTTLDPTGDRQPVTEQIFASGCRKRGREDFGVTTKANCSRIPSYSISSACNSVTRLGSKRLLRLIVHLVRNVPQKLPMAPMRLIQASGQTVCRTLVPGSAPRRKSTYRDSPCSSVTAQPKITDLPYQPLHRILGLETRSGARRIEESAYELTASVQHALLRRSSPLPVVWPNAMPPTCDVLYRPADSHEHPLPSTRLTLETYRV